MKYNIILMIFVSSLLAQKYEPIAKNKGQYIKHTEYTLQYNSTHKQADWVHHFITKDRIKGDTKRKNKFKPDTLVVDGQVTLKDYAKSGYDRGHLAPAGDFKFSQSAMNASFYLSNMSPQAPNLNRKVWKYLETQVRTWTENYDTIFVTTGPVFNDDLGSIGKNKITIPSAYYKVILGVFNGSYKTAGFILSNEASLKNPIDFIVSVDEVEKITKIDFFPELPDTVENIIEAHLNLKDWPVKVKKTKKNNKRKIFKK